MSFPKEVFLFNIYPLECIWYISQWSPAVLLIVQHFIVSHQDRGHALHSQAETCHCLQTQCSQCTVENLGGHLHDTIQSVHKIQPSKGKVVNWGVHLYNTMKSGTLGNLGGTSLNSGICQKSKKVTFYTTVQQCSSVQFWVWWIVSIEFQIRSIKHILLIRLGG